MQRGLLTNNLRGIEVSYGWLPSVDESGEMPFFHPLITLKFLYFLRLHLLFWCIL